MAGERITKEHPYRIPKPELTVVATHTFPLPEDAPVKGKPLIMKEMRAQNIQPSEHHVVVKIES
jgi:hypothetical protein